MRFLLLSLIFSSSTAINLIEIFDCGPQQSNITMKVAEGTLGRCPIMKDAFNMCCKDHDYCYEAHAEHNFTRKRCDSRFCACLFDAEDILNEEKCDLQQNMACNLVRGGGGPIFRSSHPNDNIVKFGAFEDAKPLDMDMKELVDMCVGAKGMVVHCHNSVYRCTENRKEREKFGTLAQYSHEDCESTMYECLQIIAESKDVEPCTSLALKMAADLAKPLNAERVGKAALEVYAVISRRLIDTCEDKVGIENCLRAFDTCAAKPINREKQPEFFNAARRIKIGCHQSLSTCLKKTTIMETKKECVEARNLALSRIREHEFKEAPARALEFLKDQVQRITNCVSHPIDCATETAASLWKIISTPFARKD